MTRHDFAVREFIDGHPSIAWMERSARAENIHEYPWILDGFAATACELKKSAESISIEILEGVNTHASVFNPGLAS